MSTKQTEHSIGNTIAKLRKEKGWTQAELAKKVNLTDGAISKWERDGGAPNLDAVCDIASIFGVSIDYLLTGKEREIDFRELLTLENLCKNNLSVAVEKFETKLLIGKDEKGLNILEYMVKYPCKEVVDAFFDRFPIDRILSRNHYQFNLKRDMRYCLSDGTNLEFSAFTGNQVARVLVEYKMLEQLEQLDAFHLEILQQYDRYTREKSLGAYLSEDIYLYTDEYFGRILVDDKFNGEFREKYLRCFGTEQYRDAITYLINAQQDEAFKEIWQRVNKINEEFCAVVEEDEKALSRRNNSPYALGKLTYNPYFAVDLGKEFLDWMVDNGYISEVQSYCKTLYPLYADATFSQDRIRLAELKKQGKGNTYEASLLSVMEDGLLRLDKLEEIKNYEIAKRLITEECIHKYELFCSLLQKKKYDELLALAGSKSKSLSEELNDPKRKRHDIRSWGFYEFIPSYYKGANMYDDDSWPTRWFKIEIKGIEKYIEELKYIEEIECLDYDEEPDYIQSVKEFEYLDEDQALDYIRRVKDEVFYLLWQKEEDEASEKEKQALRQKLIEKYPREYFDDLLANGETETLVIKLCKLLEGLLKTGYDYEGNLSELIDQYCEAYDVDDDTYDLLDSLRLLRNSYVHPTVENVDLTNDELSSCIDVIFEIAE